MILPAHEDGHLGEVIGEVQLAFAADPGRQGRRGGRDRRPGQAESFQTPLDPAEEQARPGIGVVIGMADVAAVRRHPAGELTHQPGAVGADQLQDRRRGAHGQVQLRPLSPSGQLQMARRRRPRPSLG